MELIDNTERGGVVVLSWCAQLEPGYGSWPGRISEVLDMDFSVDDDERFKGDGSRGGNGGKPSSDWQYSGNTQRQRHCVKVEEDRPSLSRSEFAQVNREWLCE